MEHMVTLRLGEFSLVALGAGAGGSVELIRRQATNAIRYYLRQMESAREEWRFPDFLRNGNGYQAAELQLPIDGDLWRSLETEAERQGVSVERLAQHAVLYYAADLDAGRVQGRDN